MNLLFTLALLASSGAEVPLPPKVPGTARDTLIILIAASGVGLVLLGVFTLWVKRRRSRHRHHRRHHRQHLHVEAPPTEAAVSAEAELDSVAGPTSHRHRRRKRRREHRPRNPTLAETGGLPPPRPEGQVPPGL